MHIKSHDYCGHKYINTVVINDLYKYYTIEIPD